MSSNNLKTIIIDASHPHGVDLRSNVAQLLCASDPQRHKFEKIILLHAEDDQTDWPQVDWLKLIAVKGKDNPNSTSADTIDKSQLAEMFQRNEDGVLLTLNSAVPTHPQNHVLLSDRFISDALDVQPNENFFNRIRNKVASTVTQNSFNNAYSLIGFSCFATTQMAKLNRPYFSVPLGIRPEHFQPHNEHPTINQLDGTNPFVWLTSLVDDNIGPVKAAIEAAKILHNFGSYIQVRILMPESHDGTVLTTDAEKTIADLCKGLGYAQIATASDDSELLEHFAEANGYIWNYRTDKNHRDLLFAMANGLPIISPKSEMVMKHTGNKLRFFVYNDSDDLANSIERSIADIHFRILSGARNHRSAMAYTWEKTAAELFSLFSAHRAAIDLASTSNSES